MVIFTLEKSNHSAALIFSHFVLMVLMVINVYIILIYIIIVYIFIYTYAIIKIIQDFYITMKNMAKNEAFVLDYQAFGVVIFQI